MGVMAAPPMAPMAQYTLQALAGRTIEFKVLLPNAKCGIVIGKGGAMIKHIRETSKAQVDVSEAQAVSAHVAAAQGGAGLAAERVVSFSGDFGAVYAAFQMVLSHIVANSPAVVDALGVAMPAVGGVVEAVVLVPRNKTGGLIGRAGASINRVRQDSGATVKVGAPEDVVVGDPDVRKCVVSGSIDQVMGAFTLIVHSRAGQESEIPNFKGSYLGQFPLVSANSWTSDHLLEQSRSVDVFFGTRARGTLTLKRR